jgi:hypothetical protein
MMTKQNLSKITEVVLLSFCSSSSGCHVERGLRPAIPMDVRSVNVAVATADGSGPHSCLVVSQVACRGLCL